MSNTKILSRSEIEHRISQGDAIVIFENSVLRMNKWIKYHPGGDKAVHHLVGRDATDEMIAYHCDETQATFKKWKIGEINYKWLNFLPPIQGGKFRSFEEQEWEKLNSEKPLREKLTPSSSSEDFKLSSSTEPSDVEDVLINPKPEIQHKKMSGEQEVTIKPKIPQGFIPSVSSKEAYERKVIKDPSDVIDNYDNLKVEQDLNSIPSLDL